MKTLTISIKETVGEKILQQDVEIDLTKQFNAPLIDILYVVTFRLEESLIAEKKKLKELTV